MARVRNLFGQAKDATKREGKAKKSQQKARKQSLRDHESFVSCKLSDEKLEKMSIRDLNKHLRQLPKELAKRYRKRRRILKNRKYALKYRRNGSGKGSNIAKQNASLELEICLTNEELRKVICERDEYKKKCSRLNAMLLQSSATDHA